MIPTLDILTEEIGEISYPDRTYRIQFDTERVSGYVDGLEALVQAIHLMLSTERYEFLIYSWDYGIELLDLYGKPMPYVMSEIPIRIRECLLTDDRITDVTDFEFERNGKVLSTKFTVKSNLGNISTSLEVVV